MGINYLLFLCPHRAAAAALAISDRFLAVNALALAGPPLRPPSLPNAAAAEDASLSLNVSLLSPVAISVMLFANWFMSFGRFAFAMKQMYKKLCFSGQALKIK